MDNLEKKLCEFCGIGVAFKEVDENIICYKCYKKLYQMYVWDLIDYKECIKILKNNKL